VVQLPHWTAFLASLEDIPAIVRGNEMEKLEKQERKIRLEVRSEFEEQVRKLQDTIQQLQLDLRARISVMEHYTKNGEIEIEIDSPQENVPLDRPFSAPGSL